MWQVDGDLIHVCILEYFLIIVISVLMQKCSKLTDDLIQLNMKHTRATRENEDLKKNCQELEKNATTNKEQRNLQYREMQAALLKRDQVIKERDEADWRYKKVTISTTEHNRTQQNTTQRNATQHNTTQHNTTQ